MTAPPNQVALYLDSALSPALMAHVIEQCRDLDAALLCLAPPPGALAVARLEPHLGALANAGLRWEIRPVRGDIPADLATLPGVTQWVCEGHSALARYRGRLPAPLLILLNPQAAPGKSQAPAAAPADWLAPRLHRGF